MSQTRLRSGAGQLFERASRLSGLAAWGRGNADEPRQHVSIFFGRDRGMVFFLCFLTLTAIVLPMVALSQLGRLALSLTFALTLILGAFATIQRRIVIYLVIGITISTFAVDLISELAPAHGLPAVDTTLKLVCLSILVLMTLKRTLRSGPVSVYRVAGGIAGYLLIGYTWSFAYQVLVQTIAG